MPVSLLARGSCRSARSPVARDGARSRARPRPRRLYRRSWALARDVAEGPGHPAPEQEAEAQGSLGPGVVARPDGGPEHLEAFAAAQRSRLKGPAVVDPAMPSVQAGLAVVGQAAAELEMGDDHLRDVRHRLRREAI